MSQLVHDPMPEAATARFDAPADRPVVDLDGGALNRQTALLNIVRRTNAQPPFAVLLEDAAKLAAQGVGAPFAVWGRMVAGGQCGLTLVRLDLPERSEPRTGTVPLSGATLAGHALQMGHVLTSEKFGRHDPPIDELLRHAGVVGGITVPFHVNGRPAGLLGVYSNHPRKWQLDEVVFIETVAHLLVAFSGRLLAEEQLQAERRARTNLLETVNAVVVTLDPEGRIVDLNQPGQRTTGYTLEEVRGAPFCSKLVLPADAELLQGMLRRCRAGASPGEFVARLLRKDGSQLRVAWTPKLMAAGQCQSVVMVGIDRTDQFEAMDQLQRMSVVARNAMRALQTAEDAPAREAVHHGVPPNAVLEGALAAAPSPPGPDRSSVRAQTQARSHDTQTDDAAEQPSPEHRGGPRHPYPYRQSIAPIVNGQLPDPSDFFQVECRDISSVGIAFFWDRVPDFKEMVVELGSRPQVTRLVCRVVRVAGVEHQGQRRYLVGCRFIGRCKL